MVHLKKYKKIKSSIDKNALQLLYVHVKVTAIPSTCVLFHCNKVSITDHTHPKLNCYYYIQLLCSKIGF